MQKRRKVYTTDTERLILENDWFAHTPGLH